MEPEDRNELMELLDGVLRPDGIAEDKACSDPDASTSKSSYVLAVNVAGSAGKSLLPLPGTRVYLEDVISRLKIEQNKLRNTSDG